MWRSAVLMCCCGVATALYVSHMERVKREFMYVPGNDTDKADCYQTCNDAWNVAFGAQFQMSAGDFFDFPIHRALLSQKNHTSYCDLQEKRLECYRRCGDEAPEEAWSPANHICVFERADFAAAIGCLRRSGPTAFRRCDADCHGQAQTEVAHAPSADVGTVFDGRQAGHYRRELSYLCRFQQCYNSCQKQFVQEKCNKTEAEVVIRFYGNYIAYHAEDVFFWLSNNDQTSLFPSNCRDLMPTNSTGGSAFDGTRRGGAHRSAVADDEAVSILNSPQ